MDIMRTHPMVIIGGILQENPFFVPPAEMLRELRARAGRGDADDTAHRQRRYEIWIWRRPADRQKYQACEKQSGDGHTRDRV